MGKIKRRQQKQRERDLRRQNLPRLFPPVDNWDEDLPDSAEEQCYPPQLIRVNKINDIWMEIPRFKYVMWSAIWLVAFIIMIPLFMIVVFIFTQTVVLNFSLLLVFFLPVIFLLSILLFLLKSLLFYPRGAPIRFNCKRQKVYVYEYHRSSWNPWQRWHAEIKVFNWADIHAERVLMAGHADWGHRVYCSVCKPGTFEVVDRFVLTWSVGSIFDAYGLWSHCCHYMEAKPVPTAPLLTDVPWSWTPFNTVRWPHDLDKESTTAAD
ncbi:DUF6708 domain-containing protein [Erwinia sp. JUb26]|uniref:DUF6708 domain-containing protein n=1 Tax=Erwinia sp. JUb26 TaxID=2485126 RepID=UPI000F4A1DED|nr:DUF6708 domain-containing protein [Erwinia sp. JUb26]ROR09881.1 hypothetical protein EC836_104133 [Erwinia sp. JUb26]